MDIQEFKIITGNPKYQVSNEGCVVNTFLRKIINHSYNKKGYATVSLSSKTFLVARLVATEFIPNPDNKAQVDHIDNDKTNNNVLNLRWCTNDENQRNKGIQKNNTSGVKGVYYDAKSTRYRAIIHFNNHKYHLGYFATIEEATLTRNLRHKNYMVLF